MEKPFQYKTTITSQHRLFDLHIRETFQYRDLIFLFVKRDFTAKYKQTILGPLWAVIQPLLTTVVFTIIFGRLAKLTTVDAPGELMIPGFLFYMAGNICWFYFSDCLNKTSSTFTANQHMFGKVYFPRLVVPIATVLSNLVSSGLLFRYLVKDEGVLHVNPADLRIDGSVLGDIARIGLPAGLQGMVFSISNLCVQSAINSLGAVVMAGSAAAFNIEIIAFYVLNSFSQAATTFIGQNYGARKPERCLKTTRLCLLQGNILAIAMAAAILLAGRQVLGLFNEDPAVIDAGLIRMRYILLFEPGDVFMEVMSGVMRGFGNSVPPAVLTLICVCGSRILWVNTVFRMHPDFPTLMTIYPISWIVTAVALVLAYFHMKRTTLKDFFAGTGL